jgi:hypothetical protein
MLADVEKKHPGSTGLDIQASIKKGIISGDNVIKSIDNILRKWDESDYGDDDEDEPRIRFKDPGGKSALRAASRNNPRNLPCPTCKAPNRLTPEDEALGYQCDTCANAAERGF